MNFSCCLSSSNFIQIIFVFFIIALAPIFGFSDSITSTEIDNLKTKYLPAKFANSNFTLDDAKRLLHQKCKKAGAENSHIYNDIEAAANELMQCTKNIGNFTNLLNEIEIARPNGDLDVVFQKYCAKRPQVEQCLLNFNAHLLPCLTTEERAQNAIFMHIVSTLLGFLCHKNGDPIAIFIAEEGPECIEMHKENIGNCMNATFSAYMQKNIKKIENQNADELPELIFEKKQCIDLYDFEECVLGYLEQCNDIVPANIIESMFKYVKSETKCKAEIDKVKGIKGGRNAASSYMSLNWIFVLLIVFLNGFFKDFHTL